MQHTLCNSLYGWKVNGKSNGYHIQNTTHQTHQNSSELIEIHQNSSGPIKTHQNPSKLIKIHQNSSEPIKIHQNPSKLIRTHQDSSKFIRTHRNSSESIKTHQNPSRFIRIHYNSSKLLTANDTHVESSPLDSVSSNKQTGHSLDGAIDKIFLHLPTDRGIILPHLNLHGKV